MRRFFVIGVAAAFVASAAPALSAEPNSAPAAAAIGAAPAAQAGAFFADVPPESWAYQAVARLAQEGYVTGYPDGTFGGQRPLTRYEMAVVVNRAVLGLEKAMEAQKRVSEEDLSTVRQLVATYSTEVKTIESHVADLQRRQSELQRGQSDLERGQGALQKQVGALSDDARRAHIGISMFQRAGTYYQNVEAINGRSPLRGVAPGAALPGGLGAAPLGSGTLGNFGAGLGSTQQNSLVTGPYQHGTSWMDFRVVLAGRVDPRFSYATRLESAFYPSTPSYLSRSAPSFCTTVTSLPGGCSYEDFDRSLTFRINFAFLQYTSPGGFYSRIGRLIQDEGIYNTQGFAEGGNQANGIQFGYLDRRTNAWLMALTGPSALTNVSSNQCPLGFSNCAGGNTGAIVAKVDHFLPTTQTDFGATYDAWTGLANVSWNPAAGLCSSGATTIRVIPNLCPAGASYIGTAAGPITGAYQTATTNIDTGSVFIAQLFGNRARPQFKLVLEGMKRFGSDPYTGVAWDGNTAWYAELDAVTKGSAATGPITPAVGVKGSTIYQFAYYAAGLNSLSPDSGPLATGGYQSFYFPVTNGFQTGYITAQHYFADNMRAGLIYEYFGLKPGVYTPAGSPTCPGCYVRSINGNALFFESALQF